MVIEHGKTLGLNVEMRHLPNPRVEKEEHYFNAVHTKLIDLGLEPHLLTDTILGSLLKLAIIYKERINRDLSLPTVNWRNTSNELAAKEQEEQQTTPTNHATQPEPAVEQLAADLR